MTDKAAKPTNGSIEIDGERYATTTIEVDGKSYTVRELSVDEGDDAADAATGPDGKINNRLNTRLLLAKSIVEPASTADAVGKFGSRKYLAILRAFNDLNSLPIEVPTPPAG